jgi:ADP-ribose pyrophosphatase YjhB (NUDIX family)
MVSIERDAKFCPYCGHSLGSIVVEGKQRNYCGDCKRVIYDNPVPVVAGVIVKDKSVLLVKRGIEPRKGFWSLPSGFIDTMEEAETAMIREMKEETNLDIIKAQYITSIAQKGMRYNSVLIIGFYITKYKGKLKPGDDAVEAKFFKMDSLPEFAFSKHKKLVDIVLKNNNLL